MVEKANEHQEITTCHSEAYQQTTESAETTTKTTSLTTTITQTVSLTIAHVTTAIMTDLIIETIHLLINDGTDYGKAKVVYDYMKENGYGTCVNYACQTYELCQYIGLPCYIVWTNAGMYGHTANTVYVNNAWYILDTHGGYFWDYNYGFTEVVDIDGNYISDSSIISLYSYDETIQMESP